MIAMIWSQRAVLVFMANLRSSGPVNPGPESSIDPASDLPLTPR
jgi:hypothetical protein